MPRTIFITGATAGFGRAMAHLFAGRGWNVVACGRRAERLEQLRSELGPDKVHAACFDVTDTDAARRAVESLPEPFRAIDVLVNNAGAGLNQGLAQDATWEQWAGMVELNIKGLLACTHLVLPSMVARGKGHVVNVGSTAGSYPYRTGNVYAATKAFVKHLTLNLKADLLGTGVRVTCIEPGMAETEFGLVRFEWDRDKAAQPYRDTNPLTAEDVAEAVWWAVDRPARVEVTSIELWPADQSFGAFAIRRDE